MIRPKKLNLARVIVTIVVVLAWLFSGNYIAKKISHNSDIKKENYNSAIKISDSASLEKALKKNGEHVFVYGELTTDKPVTNPNIEGEYLYIRRETETLKRNFLATNNGQTTYIVPKSDWKTTETKEFVCDTVSFCGVTFDSSTFDFSNCDLIETVNVDNKTQYKYYGYPADSFGTVFAEIEDNSFSDNSEFFPNLTVEQTFEQLETSNSNSTIWFWVGWAVLLGLVLLFVVF